MVTDFLKIFLPAAVSFFIGIAITPLLTDWLYANKMWKKKVRTVSFTGDEAKIFSQLHKEREVGTPRLGGIIIWASVLFTTAIFLLLAKFFPGETTLKLNFLSRNQTWLPLFTLIAGSLIGLVDDWLEVTGAGKYFAGGLSFKIRLALVTAVGLAGGWWFWSKLSVTAISIPFLGELALGWLLVPFFALVTVAIYSGGIIDGIDGLAGGVMAAAFGAYAGIAFFQNQIDLAAFSTVVVGAILAFLWFNIPPARFYMSETGIMGLTMSLTVLAFLTDAVFPLAIIAFPLIATSLSTITQVLSKKLRAGKKVFLVAPLHHHFEALGWPAYKVTMRYWVISVILAIVGMITALL